MIKIKVLKDTPFDKADTVLRVSDFRLKYSYFFSGCVTDEEAVNYIKEWHAKNRHAYASGIADWFDVVSEVIIPLDFICDGIIYHRAFDGFYLMFNVGAQVIPENSIGSIAVHSAETLFKSRQFSRLVPYCTNDSKKAIG